METPIAVGSVYIGVSAIGIFLNSLTIRALITQGKLKKNHSAMYTLYLQPLITDIIFELIHLFYVAPSVIYQSNLFAPPIGSYLSSFLDAAQTYCWYNNSLSQVSLAVNRFIVTVLLRLNFFTRKRTAIFCIAQHALAIVLTVTLQFVLPCCKVELYFASFSFREVLIPGVFNYGWAFIKLPAKIACSTIPLVIYCIILLSVRFIGKQLNLESKELKRRRRQELKFTMQFACIAASYVLSWALFSLLPPNSVKWIQGIPILLSLLNSTTNAVVFLLNDKKKLCSFCMPSATPTGSSY